MKLFFFNKWSSFLHKIVFIIVFTGLNTIVMAQNKIEFNNSVDYMKATQKAYQKGNWELGKKIADQGLKEYSNDSDLMMLSGKYYFQRKQYNNARYDLQKALQLDPHNVDAKKILVSLETETKRYSSAICYVNELLEVTPYWKGLWEQKINLYELQGNIVEANRLRKRLSQVYPEDAKIKKDYIYNTEIQANQLRNEGNLDDAIKLSKELVRQSPENPQHSLTLINDYLKSGDPYSALSATEQALLRFPGNPELTDKKIGILEEQKRYGELLSFLQQQMEYGNNRGDLQNKYRYYLLEAARNGKEQDPATLYGKIFQQTPGNEEAFSYIFNRAVADQQYEEALHILSRYQNSRGRSKNLAMKELMVYNRMGNTSRAEALTKLLFNQYPSDTDLKEANLKILIKDAKNKMADEQYDDAIALWNQVQRYGDRETVKVAQSSLYNAYVAKKDYERALVMANTMQSSDPNNIELLLKKADLYYKLKKYESALSSYEEVFRITDEENKHKYTEGYEELMTLIIKDLNEQYRFDESMVYVERWLQYDPSNATALRYAYNLASQTKDLEKMRVYAQKGSDTYPDDDFFKLKLSELNSMNTENYPEVYSNLQEMLKKNPYQKDVINTFTEFSQKYGNDLLHNQNSEEALNVADTALKYAPENKDLKYIKGLAYEKLKKFDSAYVYQSFYQPSLVELSDFKSHLQYLKNKSYRNSIGIYYLSSRFGDNNVISSISTLEYSRTGKENIYTGRINYTGRDLGKGYQVQAEWSRNWEENLRTKVDVAWANQFFPSIAVNASVYKNLKYFNGIEGEFGAGYRKLTDNQSLSNVVIGATKDIELWRLNARFNNLFLNGKWLYNISTNVRYNLSSPKNYVVAIASLGSSPDVDLINYQFYNGFSVLNTMVGAGFNHLITNSVSAGVLGSWINYKSGNDTFRNLYNLYLNINVSF
jgi:YaiO family outer membrane protein